MLGSALDWAENDFPDTREVVLSYKVNWLRLFTRSWLVELESSSGKGLETPRATQLAKMANRMKISNGLRERNAKEAQQGQTNVKCRRSWSCNEDLQGSYRFCVTLN